MLPQQALAALATALAVSAVPLNINLGAYSPALVVGDGEISFGNSPERASQVLQTLATGAQNGATGQANGAIPPPPAVGGAPPPREAQQTNNGAPPPPPVGIVAAERAQDGNTGKSGANINVATGGPGPEFISSRINAGFDPARKYPNLMTRSAIVVPAPSTPVDLSERAVVDTANHQRIKRDIDGFRIALAFASDALRNAPRIELGTELAGVGVIQNAGSNVPTNSAANGARPAGAVARRSLMEGASAPEEKKLGMTLIAVAEF
jgi:hypothetical protein